MLRLDWCDHATARYAVEHWHYSRRMPQGRLEKIGVWEDDRFIGVIIYGYGVTAGYVTRFVESSQHGIQLLRIALNTHKTPVSRMVAISLRMLLQRLPDLRLVITYADPEYLHHGGIYQAGNWIYTGQTPSIPEYIVNGVRHHSRSFRHRKPPQLTTREWLSQLDPNHQIVSASHKHRYLYPLDARLRLILAKIAKPYPSALRAGSIAADASVFQTEEGRAALTPALQTAFL